MRLRELVFSEDADAGQVAISFHVIEAITNDELVTDVESDVIGFHRAESRLQLAEEDANFHAQVCRSKVFKATSLMELNA